MVSNRTQPRLTRIPIHQQTLGIDVTLTPEVDLQHIQREMISSSSVYGGLKMQWTPEHAQWAEQHFDISSTTRSPAHKAEAYRGHLQRTAAATYQYAWANDDISALTASNLLKRYAEKYSGILEMPSYSEAGVPGLLNGRKVEGESWQEGVGVYSMGCVPEGVSMRKGGVAAVEAAAGMCSSPGLASSALTEPSYSSSSCGSHTHTATALHSSISSQEYGPGYGGGSYLHTSYSSQAASAPALPSPLHSSGLLQPPPPPSHPTLVPAYNGGSPNISGYNYPPAGYPSQSAVGPGYSPGGAPPPPSSYLPSGIAAPTPLPPSSSLPGYPYQSHNLGPIAPTPLNGSSANSLKRKAFYMTGQGEMDSTYGNFGGYGQARDSAESPMYRVAADSSVSTAGGGSGFDRSAEKSSLPFNPQKQQPMPSEQQQQHRKFSGQPGGPSLTPLSYASSSTLGGSRSTESLVSFASPSLSEPGAEEHRLHLSHSLSGATSSSTRAAGAEEQLKSSDPHLLDMVTSEILQQGPPVDWSDIAGLELAKATLKEEVVWPMLRPDMFGGMAAAAPRCVLLFGPRGTGRTLLGRCLASQLGAPFLQLSGSTLATKWLVEGEKILRASFLVARCRQPSVLFISEVDMLLSAQLSEESPVNRLKAELLAQLDALHLGPADDNNSQVLVVCSTSRPQDMDEGMSRYFGRRVLVPLPDSAARHHIVSQLLSQSQHKYCLSEEELALLVRRTEGFSGLDVARLCQDALVGMLHASAQGMDLVGIMPGGQMRPLTYQDFDNVFCKFQPSISQKEIDTYTEWNKMFGCGQ